MQGEGGAHGWIGYGETLFGRCFDTETNRVWYGGLVGYHYQKAATCIGTESKSFVLGSSRCVLIGMYHMEYSVVNVRCDSKQKGFFPYISPLSSSPQMCIFGRIVHKNVWPNVAFSHV